MSNKNSNQQYPNHNHINEVGQYQQRINDDFRQLWDKLHDLTQIQDESRNQQIPIFMDDNSVISKSPHQSFLLAHTVALGVGCDERFRENSEMNRGNIMSEDIANYNKRGVNQYSNQYMNQDKVYKSILTELNSQQKDESKNKYKISSIESNANNNKSLNANDNNECQKVSKQGRQKQQQQIQQLRQIRERLLDDNRKLFQQCIKLRKLNSKYSSDCLIGNPLQHQNKIKLFQQREKKYQQKIKEYQQRITTYEQRERDYELKIRGYDQKHRQLTSKVQQQLTVKIQKQLKNQQLINQLQSTIQQLQSIVQQRDKHILNLQKQLTHMRKFYQDKTNGLKQQQQLISQHQLQQQKPINLVEKSSSATSIKSTTLSLSNNNSTNLQTLLKDKQRQITNIKIVHHAQLKQYKETIKQMQQQIQSMR